jgi:prevent-host-death family protein
MKVRTGELKTHLSHYLRKVRETGEALEVCVREETVAYLVPARDVRQTAYDDELRSRLSRIGLTLSNDHPKKKSRLPHPAAALDGKTDVDTIQAMRAEKDW